MSSAIWVILASEIFPWGRQMQCETYKRPTLPDTHVFWFGSGLPGESKMTLYLGKLDPTAQLNLRRIQVPELVAFRGS